MHPPLMALTAPVPFTAASLAAHDWRERSTDFVPHDEPEAGPREWIVRVDYQEQVDTGEATFPRFRQRLEVVSAAERPEPQDLMPEGAFCLRAEVFPASAFRTLAPHRRRRYSTHYRHYLAWTTAQALGLSMGEARRHPAVDAADMDGRLERWIEGRERFDEPQRRAS